MTLRDRFDYLWDLGVNKCKEEAEAEFTRLVAEAQAAASEAVRIKYNETVHAFVDLPTLPDSARACLRKVIIEIQSEIGKEPASACLCELLQEARNEAQAEMVERCLEHLGYAKRMLGHHQNRAHQEVKLIEALEVGIRALSPDPHGDWLRRKELEAKSEQALAIHLEWQHLADSLHILRMEHQARESKACIICKCIADLDRQLAALPEVKR